MDESLIELHWYSFTYVGRTIKCGSQCTATTYTGYPEKKVLQAAIENNKEYAGVHSDAVLTGVCYLGFMTQKEFSGDD